MIQVNKEEQYTQERLDKAIGTKSSYLSNLWQLENPIEDDQGNKYWNSEGWYMAQRTDNAQIRKNIARDSELGGGTSRKACNKYPLTKDEGKRVQYMIDAVTRKFDNNPELKKQLMATTEEIIEKNYWHDTLFGVDDKTLKGANILGKVLMGYRDLNKTI